MTTVKDIAALAGVSRGTVDRVLNNRGSVNPETQKRVREIATKLNYQPNKAALALAAQKKKIVIGVILFGDSNGNQFFRDVVEGVEYQQEKLSRYGCTVILKRTLVNSESQLAAIDALLEEGIHGLVISPYNSPEIVKRINELSLMGLPVITTNTDVTDTNRLAYVGSNYYECGCTAGGLMNLITNGRAHVGIVTGSNMILCHTARVSGFIDTTAARYPGIQILDTIDNQDDDFKSYMATSNLIKRYPEMDALYFTAAGVYGGCRAVLDANKQNHIKIICFDAVEKTKKLVRDGIISATICQQPFLQGSRPVKFLFDFLTTGAVPEELHYTEASIKIRENI